MQRFLLLIFLIMPWLSQAQTFPGVQWKKCFGGSDLDYLMDIQQTFDGGYVTAGFTYSSDGDITNYRDSGDCWIMKLKPSGDIEWQKTFGGSSLDASWSVYQTKDSGYIIGGFSYSINGDFNSNKGDEDCSVIKLDKKGNLEWQHIYGGSSWDYINSILQTPDGGFFVAGTTNSSDGDVSGNHGGSDIWLIKLDSIGNLMWQKCLGGEWNDNCNAAIQTNDGGFAVTGALDPNISFTYYGYTVKLDSAGNVEWESTIYDMMTGPSYQIVQTQDGGYILPGSYKEPITDDSYYVKAHLTKLNANGTVAWRKRFQAPYHSNFISVAQDGDNGYVTTGYKTVLNAGIYGNECYVAKTDVNGNLIWEELMGGSDQDGAMRVRRTTDGYFVLANQTSSTDGDVTGSHGSLEYWIVKLGPTFSFNLSSFAAKRNCEDAQLNWQTSSETSTADFEIQRSSNGNDFETIGSVPAAGAVAVTQAYQYTDNTPLEGKNYYRLKIVSTYGTFEYSTLGTVNIATKRSYLFPNPVRSVMTIIPKCNLRTIQIFSADGKLLRNLPVSANDQYNIDYLPAAKYFLRLVYDNSKEVMQMIKL